MTASVLKQDPNTKRFKRTLIYFDIVSLSYLFWPCVFVEINKRLFESFCVWILFSTNLDGSSYTYIKFRLYKLGQFFARLHLVSTYLDGYLYTYINFSLYKFGQFFVRLHLVSTNLDGY